MSIITKTAPPMRLKLSADRAKTGVFSGYGSVVGNIDSYGDIIEPGAFAATLQAHRDAKTAPLMLWQHKTDQPIGRWTDFSEDKTGLFMVGQINLETSKGRDAWAHIEAGDINGLSIGYRTVRSAPDGILNRLHELQLLEVSVVSFPANQAARIQLGSKRELEDVLVKSGLSKEAASRLANGGWPALVGSSPGPSPDTVKQAAERIVRLTQTMRKA